MATYHPRVPNAVRARESSALENGRVLESFSCAQVSEWRAPAWPSWSLASLLLRESPLKKGFAVVDAASMRAPSPPGDPIRARAEMCLLLVGSREKMTCCTCVPEVMYLELCDVCRLIDLVSSYSIDATANIFTESDVLTWPIFPT